MSSTTSTLKCCGSCCLSWMHVIFVASCAPLPHPFALSHIPENRENGEANTRRVETSGANERHGLPVDQPEHVPDLCPTTSTRAKCRAPRRLRVHAQIRACAYNRTRSMIGPRARPGTLHSVRPISVLRFHIAEGLTQAES